LISEKQRGFFAKWQRISAKIYVSMDKSVDRVHASVDRPGTLGPPWTDADADRGLLRRGERGKGAGRGAVKLGGGAHLL
jgi:hypothetical protein